MSQNSLLIELLTEELPPKALKRLGDSFAQSIYSSLQTQGFLSENSHLTSYASPRRLAVHLSAVAKQSPDKKIKEKLLPVAIGLDANQQPTPPLIKKMVSLGFETFSVDALERMGQDKSETLYITLDIAGSPLEKGLQMALEQAIEKLPIPKVMRYQLHPGTKDVKDVSFVRPAHRLIALHGKDIIPVQALGLKAQNHTLGHRFLSAGEIKIDSADAYEKTLEADGKVIASYSKRLEKIRSALTQSSAGHEVLMPESLLEEVCSLVEWPVVYACSFEQEFLEVPQECLILTMQTNQKYFALTDSNGKLVNQFLIVSNIETKQPEAIISGNERVVRPRLADAKFFYSQDKKKTLEQRLPLLSKVVYHNKLGTQLERTQRVTQLAMHIAKVLESEHKINMTHVERAATLAKTDLLTDMVGEFPELQGIMGRYYATHDKEHNDVALACMEHYQPRFAGDALPQTMVGTIVALADKLETLVGIWGIGLQPTGEKDPFALRRHALGICRILIEKDIRLDVAALIDFTKSLFTQQEVQENAKEDAIYEFVLDRLKAYLKDQADDEIPYTTNEVEAVISLNPTHLNDLTRRLRAVRQFSQLPQAQALASANKRIHNILKKVDFEIPTEVSANLIELPAEKKLHQTLSETTPHIRAALSKGDFGLALISLAALKDPVDEFFNDVMVMDTNIALRNNRIALLSHLHQEMNRIADIGKLAN